METLQSIWHVISTPGTQLLQEQKKNILQNLSGNIDEIALAIVIISVLLGVFGSRTAKKGAYWTIVLYFFSKIILNTLSI